MIDRAQYGAACGASGAGRGGLQAARAICRTGAAAYTVLHVPGRAAWWRRRAEEGGVVGQRHEPVSRATARTRTARCWSAVRARRFRRGRSAGGRAVSAVNGKRAAFRAGRRAIIARRRSAWAIFCSGARRSRCGRGAGRAMRPRVRWGRVCDACLPDYRGAGSMKAALPLLDRKLRGFADADAVLTGVETRSSSPVRVLRETRTACRWASRGLYPCGRGRGLCGRHPVRGGGWAAAAPRRC